ncbi:MAG: hypothetical protein ACRENG_17780, partial [bacterium]
MLVKVGSGLFTDKVWGVELKTPLLTEKFRGPVFVAAVIVRLAFKFVELMMVTEFTLMTAPTFTFVTP